MMVQLYLKLEIPPHLKLELHPTIAELACHAYTVAELDDRAETYRSTQKFNVSIEYKQRRCDTTKMIMRQAELSTCRALCGLTIIVTSDTITSSKTLDGYMLCNSDTTQSRSRREQSSLLARTIALPPRHKPRRSALTQSEDEIIDRRPSPPPILRPQIDDEVFVQFFRWYTIPVEERDADEEVNHSLYRETLDARSTIRALFDPPSLGNKRSYT